MTKYAIAIQNPNFNLMGVNATIDFYRTLGLDEISNNSLTAVVTGVESAFLNMVVHSQLEPTGIAHHIKDLKQFFNRHCVPWTWSVTALSQPTELDTILLKEKFTLLEEAPSMVCDLTSIEAQTNKSELHIEEITYPSHLNKWYEVIHEGFASEDPVEDNTYQIINEKLLYTTPHKLKQYIGKIENEVVCAGTLFIGKEAVMIHNVATKKAFLKKGYATALTKHLMLEAKKLGFQYCFLDSSESGYNMYHNLGFRTYGLNRYYGIQE